MISTRLSLLLILILEMIASPANATPPGLDPRGAYERQRDAYNRLFDACSTYPDSPGDQARLQLQQLSQALDQDHWMATYSAVYERRRQELARRVRSALTFLRGKGARMAPAFQIVATSDSTLVYETENAMRSRDAWIAMPGHQAGDTVAFPSPAPVLTTLWLYSNGFYPEEVRVHVHTSAPRDSVSTQLTAARGSRKKSAWMTYRRVHPLIYSGVLARAK